MTAFKTIRKRAETRKGGARQLAALLGATPDNAALAAKTDARLLSLMAERVFCAGFVWRVIEQKWPGFETAFLGFEPRALLFQPDEFWEKLARDPRIVRNPQKIRSVRDNAAFIEKAGQATKGFGAALAGWPADDQIGLLDFLGKGGARLGGMTGQYFLRFAGWDAFILSRDVVACLRAAGVELTEKATSRKDLKAAQAQFNAWRAETGLAYTHLSRICALSIGENYDAETLRARVGGED
ncbi:MAG: DNA-3-methyladenine glycosylase I [Hyphomicrobiales bacterium]|nr:DNA-3-methyladenine glycosylase I [Hyphomicrobiales bacterium]